jgi:hypothetical protein
MKVARSSQPSGTTSTIPSIAGCSSSALTEAATRGSSPKATNALGCSAPRRSPDPAATTTAQTATASPIGA